MYVYVCTWYICMYNSRCVSYIHMYVFKLANIHFEFNLNVLYVLYVYVFAHVLMPISSYYVNMSTNPMDFD